MVTALLDTSSDLVADHLIVGCSTGYMTADRGDWEALVAHCARTSVAAAELSALSENELPGLSEYLGNAPALPFDYVSVHAPSKGLAVSEPERVRALGDLPPRVDAVITHPDTIEAAANWAALGPRLVIENMDTRKPAGRTADELEPIFAALPKAGFCFDIAHAKNVDPTLGEAHRLLDRFGDRLRQVHLSSLDSRSHHVSLTPDDEALFAPVLRRCGDVPWILEAPPT